jgi:hypothetical protein
MSILDDARKLRPIIEQAMQAVDDNTALKAKEEMEKIRKRSKI